MKEKALAAVKNGYTRGVKFSGAFTSVLALVQMKLRFAEQIPVFKKIISFQANISL